MPTSPYFLQDAQPWAVDQFAQHHEEAIYRMGEYAVFYLMWQAEDFDAGLVERCSVCFLPYGEITEAHQQSAFAACPNCFGTTFEGGFKSRIVRPMLLRFDEEQDQQDEHGVFQTANADIESTKDFRMRVGDFVVRGDNSRWQVRNVDSTYLTTGFQFATAQNKGVGYAYGSCALVEVTSPIYLAEPVTAEELVALLDIRHPHYPVSFSDFEIIRGDLIDRAPAPEEIHTIGNGNLTWGEALNYTWDDVSTTTWGDI